MTLKRYFAVITFFFNPRRLSYPSDGHRPCQICASGRNPNQEKSLTNFTQTPQIPGIRSVHELHVWRLGQHKTVATAHIVVSDPDLAAFMARAQVIGECLHAYGIHSTTLQPELLLVPSLQESAPVVSDSSSSSSTTGSGSAVPDGNSGTGSSADERSGEGTAMATEARAEAAVPLPCQIVCGKGRCGHLMCCNLGAQVTV